MRLPVFSTAQTTSLSHPLTCTEILARSSLLIPSSGLYLSSSTWILRSWTPPTLSEPHQQKTNSPNRRYFPSLQYLRVSFKQLAHDETDGVTFMAPGTHMGHRVERELHHRLFPKIDALVDRVAPLETEVMVSCRSWGWYKHVDLYLLERQGLEVTKPQTSGNQGIKCWREHPSRLPQWQQEEELVQQASHLPFTPRIIRSRLKPPVGSLRKGYWIHIPWYKIQSPGLIEHNYLERLDGRRRNLYSADISNLAIQNTAS